jgi:hypothetical protein
MLARAGWGRAQGVDPYIWRQEGASLRRIALNDDLAGDGTACAVGLRGGDIVIVE